MYSNGELLRAAASCAAEFQIFRRFGLRSMEDYSFKDSSAANTQLAIWRQGRLLGLISFIVGATKFNGARFDETFAARRGWGLRPRASASRLIQAVNGVRSFPAILRLLAYDIGVWPIKMVGA